MARARTLHRLQRAAEVLLGVTVLLSALALGGAPEAALFPIAGLCWLCFALWCAGAALKDRRARWHLALLLPLGVAALALLQLIPLPPALLALLSPAAAELREFSLVPLGLEGWRPVSLAPVATWRELAKHLGYASALFVALQACRDEAGQRRLAGWLSGAGVVVVGIGLVHRLLGLEELFGVYSYVIAPKLLSTFGNTNHLAAFLTVCGAAATGLTLATRDRQAMAGHALAAVTIALGALLSLSRGGVAFFLFSQVLLGLLLVGKRGGGVRGATPWALAALAMGLAGYLTWEQLVTRAQTVSSVERLRQTKIELWPDFARGAAAFMRAGMGRGAFEVGFTRYQDRMLEQTFTHPESLPLQLAAELGLLPTLAFFGLLLALAVAAFRRAEGPLALAALAGLSGVLLHDVFDFALELPATALAACALAGIAFAPGLNDARPIPARPLGIAAVCALVLLMTALSRGAVTLAMDEAAFAARVEGGLSPEAFAQQLTSLIDRHPSNYGFYRAGAREAVARNDPRAALAWVNRVLFLRPEDGPSHTAAAQALVRLGRRDQALGELRLALQRADPTGLPLALRIADTTERLEHLVGDDRTLAAQVAQSLAANGRISDATALVERAMAGLDPAQTSLELVLFAADLKSRAGDLAGALSLLDPQAWPSEVRTRVELQRGALLLQMKRPDEAEALLTSTWQRAPEDLKVGLSLASIYEASGRRAKAREVLSRLLPFAAEPSQRAWVIATEGASWDAEGSAARAARAYRTVAQLEPNVASHHYRVAQLEERLGHLAEAAAAVRRGMAMDSPTQSEAQQQWLARLEKALEAKPLGRSDSLVDDLTENP